MKNFELYAHHAINDLYCVYAIYEYLDWTAEHSIKCGRCKKVIYKGSRITNVPIVMKCSYCFSENWITI